MTDDQAAWAALIAGVAAGVIFFIISTVEVFRRPGFNIARHAISMLSLGQGGWVMKAVFIVTGLLTLFSAWGIYQAIGSGLAGLIAAVLIAFYGAGLVMAGLFDAPSGLGFPVGTPLDQQPVMTTTATLHSVAFMVAFGALILACFVFAWHFAADGQTLLALTSGTAGLLLPALIYLGVSSTVAPGIAFYWAAMAGWAWLGVALWALTPKLT